MQFRLTAPRIISTFLSKISTRRMDMQIHINRSAGIAEIWLAKTERDDHAISETLKPLYKELRAQKLLPTVFLSGERELCGQTSALLCYNRRRIAEMETRKERISAR